MCIEFMAGFINLIIGFANLNIGEKLGNFSYGNLTIGFCLIPLGLFFLKLGSPIRKKIKKLEQEKAIRE